MKRMFFGLLILCAGKAFACPVGEYDVVGWNPGVAVDAQASYHGTASVKAAGNTCNVQWKVASDEYAGVGLYNPSSRQFTVSYANLREGWFGIADYQLENNVLNGRWAVFGDNAGKLGVEKLTKK